MSNHCRWRAMLAAGAAISFAALTSISVQAQTIDNVAFDCEGSLSDIVETAEGVRATGQVMLTVDLPNGAEWRSAGVIVLELPPQAAGRRIDGVRINRCMGEGTLDAQLIDNVKGVDIYSLRLDPTRVRIKAGNRRITDPAQVGFASTASGSPNV